MAAAEELQRICLPVDVLLQEAGRTADGTSLQRIGQVQDVIRSPVPIATLEGHQGEVRQAVFSPTGNFMATSTITGDVRIWNPESFQLVHQITLKLGPATKAPAL